jgi:hypothetical protein
MASTPVPGTGPGPNGVEGLLELTMTDEFGDAFVLRRHRQAYHNPARARPRGGRRRLLAGAGARLIIPAELAFDLDMPEQAAATDC